MAAEYEVNIKLNTKQIDAELKSIDKTTKNIGKGVKQTIDPSVRKLQAQGLALRRLAKSINPLLRQADKVAVSLAKQADVSSKKFLPSSKDLNAAGRGIKRLTTEKEKQAKLDVRAEQGLARRARKIREINRLEQEGNETRAKFLAGAQIPGLRRGQVFGPGFPTSGPSMPIGAGRNQYGRPIGPAMAPMQGPTSFPVAGTAGIPGSPEFNRALEIGRFRSSPIGGATNIAGSPAARRARRQRLEQVGLGAGFPLLFGGGAGSIIGGAAGGLTGSFGAQIAFSAIGQQIDQFVAGIVEAGKAFTSVGGAADFMAEKSLFSSDAMQFRIEKLIEEGKVTEAAALMSQEMAKQVGVSGLKALKDLGDEASKMGKIFSTLLIRVQAFLAKALTPLLTMINRAVGGLTAQSQLDQMIAEAGSPEQGAQILARSKELRGVTRHARTGKAKGLGQLTPEIIQKLQEEFPAVIPEEALIKPTQLEILRAADAGGGKAAREEERLQKRLGRLEAERKKVLQVSRFKDKIAAAEAAEDKQLVIRLKGEQKLAEIEASREKALAGITDQREIDAINIGKATEKLAAHRETERQLAELQRQRQEKFNDTIDDLDHQLALARATTEEERQRLRIQQKLAVLEEGGMSEDDLEAVRAKMEELADENSPLNRFIRQTREQIEQLNDPVFQVIELSKRLGSAFTESFRGIIDGSMTAQQALANLFQRTADHFLDMAMQMIAAQIQMKILGIAMNFFGGGGGFGVTPSISDTSTYASAFNDSNFVSGLMPKALGGAVGAGRPYVVGERGPELFVPGAQGNIVPNNAMGGVNVGTINISVENTGDQLSPRAQKQLANQVRGVVLNTLANERRGGGML